MFDAAVAAGIAAFLSGDDPPGDAEVRTALESQGVEPWLAQHLVVFLPLAFGRLLFNDVTVSDAFLDGSATRLLGSEPVFRAAWARAAIATRQEVERIGLRSAEVDAVNQALHNGSLPEDLVLGPAALVEPLMPAVPGDGGVPSPREAFAALLRGHGFPVDDRDGLRVGAFGFDARVFPYHPSTGVIVQVDFEVRHPDLAMDWLLESFGGAGSTWHEAITQTIMKFERASLHPLIAALLDRSACQDQVQWERFTHPQCTFDLCLGPQLSLYSARPLPSVGPVLDAMLEELRNVPLSRAVHSFRVYTCYQDRVLATNEVLLDNQPWPAGEAIIAEAPPAVDDGMVGSRVFALLVPSV